MQRLPLDLNVHPKKVREWDLLIEKKMKVDRKDSLKNQFKQLRESLNCENDSSRIMLYLITRDH